MAENIPNPTPAPGSEVANAFPAAPSAGPALEAPQPPPESVDVPPEGWTPDEWALQTVNLDAPEALGQPAPPAEPKPAAVPQGYVPQQALAEARAEARAQAEKIERMNQRFEDTIRLLQGRMGGQDHPQPAAPAPALPDPEQEPVKHMQARFDRIEQAINGLIGMSQQNVAQNAAVQQIQAREMAFRTEHQDYDAALNHTRATLTRTLRAGGLPPDVIAQMVAANEVQVARAAMQNGSNPAEAIYNMARELGYKNGNGQTTEQAQAASAAVQKVVAAQQGVQNAKTLGNVAGQSASVGMTLEHLSDIQDPAEFAKAFDKLMGNQRTQRSQLPAGMFSRR